MAATPGVVVEVRTLTDDSNEAINKIAVELMAGQADILIESTFVAWQNRAAQNLFADWYSIMVSDSRFNRGDYFTSVFVP